MPRRRSFPLLRLASKAALALALLGSLSGIAAAQPANSPMGVSVTSTDRDRVWASTAFGDLATWDPSSGWQVRVRGGVVGGVGAITYPGSVHREQAFYVREGRVRSLPLLNGSPGAEIVLPGYGSASFAGSAVAATRYGQIGIVVGAFTTTGTFCAWTGSTFGFTTAPTCVSGADRYSALVATTMFSSQQSGSFVTFFYRGSSGDLVRRMRRSTSTGDGAWGSTVMARGVSRPLALTRDALTGIVTLAFVQSGRVRVSLMLPGTSHANSAIWLPPTSGTISNNSGALALGFGEGPGFNGLTRCTTHVSVSTSAGSESAFAFSTATGACAAPSLTTRSSWSAIPQMPAGAVWGSSNLVLRGLWFGHATRTLGVGLRSSGWLQLPYALLEVDGLNVISHGSP